MNSLLYGEPTQLAQALSPLVFMRLEQLEAFLAITEMGSFQAAAQRCGVTQSTISRQIQTLESELQAVLLHRQAQVKVTVAGAAE